MVRNESAPRNSARLKLIFDMKFQIMCGKTRHTITTITSAGGFKMSLGIDRMGRVAKPKTLESDPRYEYNPRNISGDTQL